VKLNYIILAVICTVLAIFAAPVVGIYHLSEATSAVTVELLVLHSFCMIIWPLSFTLPNALRAAADVKFTMCVSVFSMWVFRIGCSYLLVKGFGMGVNGIWIAMFVDWVFRAILFVARFVSGRWKGRTLAES
jgi:Na+-driven multidrug efflux pump